MPIDGISIAVDGMADVIEALVSLPGKVGGRRLEDALRRGAQVTVDALRDASPIGPTGNLQRAAAIKTVSYGQGSAVAVVGYRRSGSGGTTSSGGAVRIGPDRAFHQYWIEDGTAVRRLKNGTIASSLAAYGPAGSDYFADRGYGGKAGWSGAVVVFRPKDGELGAIAAQHPMESAWRATRSIAKSEIESNLREALNQACAEVAAQ